MNWVILTLSLDTWQTAIVTYVLTATLSSIHQIIAMENILEFYNLKYTVLIDQTYSYI